MFVCLLFVFVGVFVCFFVYFHRTSKFCDRRCVTRMKFVYFDGSAVIDIVTCIQNALWRAKGIDNRDIFVAK